MKVLWEAMGLMLLVLSGCDRHLKVTDAPDLGRESGGFSLAIPIPKAAVGTVARVEYVVSGADMDTLRGPAPVEGDTLVRVAIEGVKPGKARVVALNAYDSGGKLVYAGSATTDVVGGETARVDIVLRLLERVPGASGRTITETLPGGAIMEFVWIAPGTFVMGTTEEQGQLLQSKEFPEEWSFEDEQPAHEVTISKGFYLGKYEITQSQWEGVMGTRPWEGQDFVQENPSHPAVYISWDDMQDFIHRLNQAAGDSLYRLPTEAEWEYACRAGTNTLWSFGDDESRLGDYAWYFDNAWGVGEGYAHQVGTKLSNPWGLYDMHGNVSEWVQDWYGEYTGDSQTNPSGPAIGSDRVLRGGEFDLPEPSSRSAARSESSLDFYPYYGFGARLVRTK